MLLQRKPGFDDLASLRVLDALPKEAMEELQALYETDPPLTAQAKLCRLNHCRARLVCIVRPMLVGGGATDA